MLRKKTAIAGLGVGIMGLMGTPAFARSISLKDAGISLWIFIVVGAVIILLQLIPALILLFSFIGTASSMMFRRGKTAEEEGLLPGYGPRPVKE